MRKQYLISIINEPKILLADEPTGNLDTQNALHIAGLMKRPNDDGLTIVMVTHNAEEVSISSRIDQTQDGKIHQ